MADAVECCAVPEWLLWSMPHHRLTVRLGPFAIMIQQSVGSSTSTPHQPANARFAPGLQPNAGECRRMRGRKIREIKGLLAKQLISLIY